MQVNHDLPNINNMPPWVGADVAGGTTAITSGLASWASAFGPWGTAIAIGETAALSSCFS